MWHVDLEWRIFQADKNKRLQATIDFQHGYQNVLSNISVWLDCVEVKMFGSVYDPHTDGQMENHGVISSLLLTIICENINIADVSVGMKNTFN